MGIHQKNHQDSKNTVCTTDGLILTLRYAFGTNKDILMKFQKEGKHHKY